MDPRADRRAPWVMESRIRHRRGVASTVSNEEVANNLIDFDFCLSGCPNTTSLSYFNE